MAKTKISEFSSTPANNTDIDSINIAEGCAPSGINDAIRELMAQLKDFQTGAQGDSFNGPVGTTTAAAGAFTNITASGTLGVTGVATLGAGAILNTPASVTLTNATGLPISTGVSGLGTGVATALAVNTGSSGAVVVNGGALGTPSSGTVTNLTGTASININGTVGATTPTTGAFTTTTVSSSETLSYGTANGVTYLNGSKVLTSGSALTFDGTNLGVGIATPASDAAIHVNRSGASFPTIKITNGTTGTGNLNGFDLVCGSTGEAYVFNRENQPLIFGVNNTEAMRLTSIGLGIGTSSPAVKFDVGVQGVVGSFGTTANDSGVGVRLLGASTQKTWLLSSNLFTGGAFQITRSTAAGGTTYSTPDFTLDSSGNLGLGTSSPSKPLEVYNTTEATVWARTTTGYSLLRAGGTGGDFYFGIDNSTGAGFGQGNYSRVIYSTGAYPIVFSTNATERMRLDSSGNLGIGTSSPTDKLSIYGGSIRLTNATTGTTGSDGYSMETSGLNAYLWNYEAGFLSFATSATERARIDSSGNLLLGATSAASGSKFWVQGDFVAYNGIGLYSTNASGTDYQLYFIKNGTARGSITTTTSGTQFNTSSDYRLKNITGPITTSGAYIDSLNPVEGTWKADGSIFVGLIAHEVQEASRTQVATGTKDGEEMQAMDYSNSELIANLIAEVKSLRQRVAQLEAQ